MTNRWLIVRNLLMALTLAILIGGALALRRPIIETETMPPLAVAANTGPANGDPLSGLATSIQARNPFRASRRAAARVFMADTAPSVPPRPAAPPAPAISLAGILLGARPGALLLGLPGADAARLLAPGEQNAGFTLLAVERDSVLVGYRDSVIVLRMRRPAT
jgi:hypothetical protein